MLHRPFAFAVALAGLMTLGAGTAFAATSVLDQEQANHEGISIGIPSGTRFAQTFTAGVSGTLEKVQLDISAIGTVPNVTRPAVADGVTVSILATDVGGVPTGAALDSTHLAVSVGWNPIAFASTPALTSGTMYAIEVEPDAGQFVEWAGTCLADQYTGGRSWVWDGPWRSVADYGTAQDASGVCILDFAFQTFMVAAPANTLPPTATAPAQGSQDAPALPVVLAGLIAVLAAISIRRVAVAKR